MFTQDIPGGFLSAAWPGICKRALYVNEAYETITGQSLRENPSSYEDTIHPEDRVRVLAKLDEATETGHFNERLRITCANGEIRWVWVQGIRTKSGEIKLTAYSADRIDFEGQSCILAVSEDVPKSSRAKTIELNWCLGLLAATIIFFITSGSTARSSDRRFKILSSLRKARLGKTTPLRNGIPSRAGKSVGTVDALSRAVNAALSA